MYLETFHDACAKETHSVTESAMGVKTRMRLPFTKWRLNIIALKLLSSVVQIGFKLLWPVGG
jgi:hypothetical protein